MAGLWDQTSVKQTVVDGYDRLTTAARPIYNVAARIIGSPRLPRPGSMMRAVYGSFFCAKDGDPGIVRELIDQLLALAADRGHEILYLGFTESDPSLAAARTRRHIAYRAGMYSVTWDDGDDFHDRLDARPRYLELATL